MLIHTPPVTPTLQKISVALNISLPEHVLMAKMLARRSCADCGKGYNLANIKEGEMRPTARPPTVSH